MNEQCNLTNIHTKRHQTYMVHFRYNNFVQIFSKLLKAQRLSMHLYIYVSSKKLPNKSSWLSNFSVNQSFHDFS